jgi:hypothetical protein
MRLSSKLFLGAIVIIFALVALALVWGRSAMKREIDTILEGVENVETRTLDLPSFQSINLEGPFDVRLHSGEGSHRFSAPTVLLDRFRFFVKEDRLEVTSPNPFLPKGIRMSIDLYIPQLSYINGNGSVFYTTDEALNVSSTLRITMSEEAKTVLTLAPNNVVKARTFGASYLELRGETGELNIETHGTSKADLYGLSANSAIAEAEGASSINLVGTASLNLFAEEAASIFYKANETTTVSQKNESTGQIKRIID